MKIKLLSSLLLLLITCACSMAQYCTSDNRFTQIPVFATTDIQEDSVVYANVTDWQGVHQDLKLNIFYPKNSVETLSKRPMIMMIFGGGFINGDRSQVDAYCVNFARRGFVAVGIDYRLGKETILPCSDTLSQEKAVYRAIQDAHAAMRYMVANAAIYRIDTAWIFAGGYSAGAGIANALVYNSKAEFSQFYPGIVASLGSIDTSGNAYRNAFFIKGIYNNWGGVSSDFFDIDEAVPTVSFHGGNDGVVPVDSAIDITCFTTSHYIFGSRALYQKLTAAGICSDLTVQPGKGHGIYQGADGQLMRTSRATCFFKSLFCNSCRNYSSLDSLTPDCATHVTAISQNSIPENKLAVYPNPVSQTMYVQLPGKQFQVMVYDNVGRQVFVQDNNFSSIQIDCSKFSKGIYIITAMTNSGELFRQKILVH